MHAFRLRAPLALALVCCFGSAQAQLAIQNGSSVTEDFASLASTGTGSSLPTGWAFLETGSNADTTYAADNGASQSGNTYSYGETGSSERALGMLLSGSLVPTIGVHLQNTGATTITSLDVAYTGEQWRFGATGRGPDRLDFQYSTNATSLSGGGTWTDVDTLDFISPVNGGSTGPLVGNAAGNRTAISGTLTGISVAPGGSLWVRWVDVNIAPGADDGLAIDDVRFGQAVDNRPSVAATSPLPNAQVALNANLSVTFNEPVTVSPGWFALACGAGTPVLTASGGPSTYTFTHTAPLPSGANCALTLEADLVQDLDGTIHTMAADYVLPFTTVVDVAPTLVSTVPANGASTVARGADLRVTFSEPVSAAAGAFTLECPDGVAIPVVASSEQGTVFDLDPNATLPANTACELTIAAAQITDVDGVPQTLAAGAQVLFTTAPVAPPVVLSTVPADDATNFPAAGELIVTFDQNVTVNASAFSLACDTTTGITLTHASSGTVFELSTGTSLTAEESCTLHIEADGITSDDGLHPAGDTDIVFAVAASGTAAYYASVNLSSKAQLRCTLNRIIDGHTKYPYSTPSQPGQPGHVTDTWDILNIADQDPANSGRVVDIYRNESYVKHNAGNNDYNREHTWPNSLGFPDQDQLAAYTDTHMLYISNDTYNSTRGNTPYGNCTSGCTTLATLHTNGRGGTPDEANKYQGDNIFQVWSGRKGDAARAVMYMAIRYEGADGTPDLELTNDLDLVVGTPQTAQKAYMGKLDDLIAWHEADPPDAQEVLRNEAVASFQGNRNPFIDHPEWGTVDLFTSVTPAVCQPNTGGNVAPVAMDDQFAATEDTTLNRPSPGVLGNDSDANGNILSAVRTANAANGNVTLQTNGAFSYVPNANFCGTESFSYQASDGALTSTTALVTLNVACTNDAPVATDATFALPENSSAGTAVGSVTASDIDAGQTRSYAITAGNSAGAFAINASTGAITVANAAPLDFETTPQFVLTVTVTDNGAPPASDTATITINLSNVDEGAAVANNDFFTVNEDAVAAVIDVLVNDMVDPDTGTIAVTDVGTTPNATVGFTAGGLTYTPAADFCGSDSVSYTVSGGDTANVAITVNCVVDAPEAVGTLPDRSATLGEAIVPFSVAGAFASPDEAPTYSADGLPAGLSILPATGEISGTPTVTGSFAVTARATNGAGSATVGFTFTVGEPPDTGSSIANDDTLTVLIDSAATAVDVLSNDVADPDTGTIAVTAVTAASNGTTSFTASGVSYTPAAGFCGADSFQYTVDGGDTATVAVTVQCLPIFADGFED